MTLNIHQRLLNVMKDVNFVEKDTTVAFKTFKYRAVSHDAVVAIVRPVLIKHGVLLLPSVSSSEQIGDISRLNVAVNFVNVDDPQDKHVCHSIGYGQDPGDKGPGKAFSYAVKTAVLKTFSLETGENDEDRHQTTENSKVSTPGGYAPPTTQNSAPRKGPSEAQLKRLFAIAKSRGVEIYEVDALLAAKFGIKSKSELTREQYDGICNLIDSGNFPKQTKVAYDGPPPIEDVF